MLSFVSRNSTLSVLLLLIVICVAMLLVTSGAQVGLPKGAGQGVLSVLQGTVTTTTRWIRDTFNSIGELRKAKAELELLRERLGEAERLSRDIVRLRRENAQLRELLGLSQQLRYANIRAMVIAKQPGNAATQLVINKGARDGVERHMPVVAQQGGTTGLVGKTVSVSARSATILPITGSYSFVAARIEESRFDGLLEGRGDGTESLLLRHVSKLGIEEIRYGDLVVTSGLGRVFPADIQVGRVRAVRSVPDEPSLQLEVEPLIDLSRLEHVLVIRVDR
jgi:rod shape-determining protein MreC